MHTILNNITILLKFVKMKYEMCYCSIKTAYCLAPLSELSPGICNSSSCPVGVTIAMRPLHMIRPQRNRMTVGIYDKIFQEVPSLWDDPRSRRIILPTHPMVTQEGSPIQLDMCTLAALVTKDVIIGN